MQPVTCTITDPAVLARLRAATRGKDEATSATIVNGLAEQALRVALGLCADLTPEQAASRLGCSRQTVLNYVKNCTLPHAYFISSHEVRIPVSDLEALKKRTIRIW